MGVTHQGGYIDGRRAVGSRPLKTTAHSKVFINGSKTILGVSLRDDAEELDVVQDLVVEGKVIAWNDVDASIFLDLPVFQSQSLSFRKQFFLGDLASPICFGSFLEVTIDPHTREPED